MHMNVRDPICPAQHLDYAPAPSRRRRWIRRIVWSVLAIAVVIAGWHWGPAASRRAQILYWQHQCMVFHLPPEQVVYEEDPLAAAKLLAAEPGRYVSYTVKRLKDWNGTFATSQAAAIVATCWNRLSSTFAPGWHFSAFLGSADVPIFLHERTSPAGHRRLVCVNFFPEQGAFQSSFIPGFNVDPLCIIPGTPTLTPAIVQQGHDIDVMSWFPKTAPNTRIYAGQPDPSDPSHFTIRYQMWGQEDVLDGRLNDRDEVTLTPRKIPTEPR